MLGGREERFQHDSQVSGVGNRVNGSKLLEMRELEGRTDLVEWEC